MLKGLKKDNSLTGLKVTLDYLEEHGLTEERKKTLRLLNLAQILRQTVNSSEKSRKTLTFGNVSVMMEGCPKQVRLEFFIKGHFFDEIRQSREGNEEASIKKCKAFLSRIDREIASCREWDLELYGAILEALENEFQPKTRAFYRMDGGRSVEHLSERDTVTSGWYL